MRSLGRPTRGLVSWAKWRQGHGGLDPLRDGNVFFDPDELVEYDESWVGPATLTVALIDEMNHAARPGTQELAEHEKMQRVNVAAFPAEILAFLRWVAGNVELPAVSREGNVYQRLPYKTEIWRATLKAGLANLPLPAFDVTELLRRGHFGMAVGGFRFHLHRRPFLDGATARFQPSIPLGLLSEVDDFCTRHGIEFSSGLAALFAAGIASDRGGLDAWSLEGPPWPVVSRCRAAVDDFAQALRAHMADIDKALSVNGMSMRASEHESKVAGEFASI